MCQRKKCPNCPDKEVVTATQRDAIDVEWLVEQRLSKLLADREQYSDGFYYGMFIGFMAAIVLFVLAFPEIKKLAV